ncbi:MAG: putative ligase-like protein [Gemmatimonadetes bacterium]|nr:putative ligase-like protein [Gemmatimonadota bacterium]
MTALTPMLATVGTEIPAGEGWVFEPKYDGIRILAFVTGNTGGNTRGKAKGKVVLLSRNGLDKTHSFPEIADALSALYARVKKPFVLDGEIVAMQGDSPLRFQQLQGRMHTSDGMAIENHRADSPTALIVFDLLQDGKTSLVKAPWRERRTRLEALMRAPGRPGALRISDVSTDGKKMLREARAHDWEGIIAKRADAPYEVGRRSHAWIKLKIERRQEFVVGGWTEPRKSREHIGAILLGYYNDRGELVYSGHTGTGFTRKSLLDMYQRLKRYERKTSPFSTTPKTNEKAHWTRPAVVAEIKFNEWTADGRLRQPVFLGIRDDKDPRDVVHEPESLVKAPAAKRGRVRKKAARGASSSMLAAAPAEAVAEQLEEIERNGGAGELALDGGELEVSNLDKMFFPATKQTKGDLMRFYARIAPYLLPAIADRPLVMKRFPNGITGKAFYQQKAPSDAPAGVRVEAISDDGMTTRNALVGGDLATLLYLAQLGAISVDPWHSRVQSIRYADYAIIDLDPGPRAPFRCVVEVALAVKEGLDRLRMHAVPKTSGASGLHIAVPLPPRVPNDGARMVAELVATMVAERHPTIATVERWVKARPVGAVYVDFLQNIRGKTVAGVYSVRAQPRATVSTPLAWDEVNDELDPAVFTMDTVLSRIEAVGDLWATGMATPNTLEGVIGRG